MVFFFCIFQINGVNVIKSGIDFREFSIIIVIFFDNNYNKCNNSSSSGNNFFLIDVERVEVISDILEDIEVKFIVDKYVGKLIIFLFLEMFKLFRFQYFSDLKLLVFLRGVLEDQVLISRVYVVLVFFEKLVFVFNFNISQCIIVYLNGFIVCILKFKLVLLIILLIFLV